MKVKKYLMIAFLCVFASNCGSRDEKTSGKDIGNKPAGSTMGMSYSEFVDANMYGESSKKIQSILGDPDVKRKNGSIETWHYGPDMDATINGAPGAIIGLTISFDAKDRVVDVSPSRKSP